MSDDRALAEYGLRPAQEEFLKRYLGTGDIEEAAAWAERKPSTCRQWLKEPKFQQALQRELTQRLNGGAMGALETLISLSRHAGDDKVRLNAARDLLDRAGYKPEHLHTSADKRMENASVEDMMGRIQELQKELGINQGKGDVIDVEPQDVGSGNGERSALPEPPRPGDADPLEPQTGGMDSGSAPQTSGAKAQNRDEEPERDPLDKFELDEMDVSDLM